MTKLAIGLGAAMIAVVAFFVWPKSPAAPTESTNTTNTNSSINTNDTANNNAPTQQTTALTRQFSTQDIDGADKKFLFSATIPTDWKVESVDRSQALNIYNSTLTGTTNLDRSQIFIKYFTASSFLTLTTVDILARTESTLNGRPAVTYQIKKKPSVADFPNQPAWRNEEHRVTDIRSTDQSPTTFYVFAKAPHTSDAEFDDFLRSIQFET